MIKLKVVFIDIETSSLHFMNGVIRLIAFFDGNSEVVTTTMVDDELREILKNKDILKVFHNAKFDVDVNDNITMNRKWKIKMYKNDH